MPISLSFPMLDDRVAVSGQLRPDDMAGIAAAGFVAVVNNRPDGEAMFGQPRTADIAKAAEAAGLAFVDLPFSGPHATPDQVRALAKLLAATPGKVVVYCKSGMRSTLLWGAAALAGGRPLADVLAATRRASQNVEPVADIMTSLAQAARE
ncbi:MAG: TIGR01244 family sulfur transferase [Reyranellaceae bacterium]